MSRAPEKAPASAIAVYSGGMDSTVMLSAMLEQGIDVKGALSIDYGQKHRKEIVAAADICAEFGIEHRIADLRGISELFGHSGLTDSATEVPEGHYEEDSMKQTVVPNRNMILISVATAWAITKEAEAIAYAAHSGDHAIYPDCRVEFADALDDAIRLCDWSSVWLYRPFVDMSKQLIVAEGARLGSPMGKTWSCYKGGALHCGKCGTCIERREAFHLAEIDDPTVYAANAPSVVTLIECEWRLSDL
ncbi:MAG: 7-cyano-7-deazaguanine synthase [Candidatus Pelagisphaera sp.]|jgi:7-cyano-7-deazaguanine synthase